MDSLRVYLLPDGRDDSITAGTGATTLLPAEGAIFMTNYRLIFKGSPCDPYGKIEGAKVCKQTARIYVFWFVCSL